MGGVATPEDPDGLMVLALWVETSGRVVIRISRSRTTRQKLPEQSYASTKSEVLRAVESWLDAFVTPP
jgi:hypothetical protein